PPGSSPDAIATAASTGVTGTTPVVVSRAPTTLGIASSDNPYVFGEPVTLSASVFPATGFGEGGTVTFYDNGAVVGTAPVTFGQAAMTTTFREVGTDVLTARYSGDGDFIGSSSMAPVSETAASG
ncbi:MAG TPA: Ig-like domain-containing protein, partial [Acidimicrobiales bacterium]|nr:Ig-like domain-containing protein [Acidimicrobiales bacterium]